MRPDSKTLRIIFALLFWSFTWHAYAVSAAVQIEPSAGGKSHLEKFSGNSLDSRLGEDKAKFKRRPFLIKSHAVGPDLPTRILLMPRRRDAEVRRHLSLPSPSASSLFLRSPPLRLAPPLL